MAASWQFYGPPVDFGRVTEGSHTYRISFKFRYRLPGHQLPLILRAGIEERHFFLPLGLRISSPSLLSGAVMWKWTVIGWMLLGLCVAAPPQHINRLALFPDKSAWCEAKNITQIIGHTGCQPQSIQNRACLGQCFSYSVPNTFPQLTESLVHCDSCMPAQLQWEVVTLECPGNKETAHVDKLVERILHCSCQSCTKEIGQDGALLQLFPPETTSEPPSKKNEAHSHRHSDTHSQHAHTHADSHPRPNKPGEG
ncbi:hypothetical protein AGOR_G00135820 [Albula goreensis]|uniref:CTCK domain-containing protein n=1 Tax=Albula goreensis TaxID=1534307 RepID=A0A8T3DAL7_9TELE|nr:hypothetical protein AGOR_G00135820 [Albula goreensis]